MLNKLFAPVVLFIFLSLHCGSAFAFDFSCGWIRHAPGNLRTVYMLHDYKWRSYQLYVPRNYSPGAALVLDFHGQTSSKNSQMVASCWKDLADREGAVVVYPQALSFPSTWDGGDYCCHPRGHDDEGFALKIVQCLADTEKSGLEIDSRRIFVSGLSNGASMAGKLACDHSDVFAGVALASQSFPYVHAESCRAQDERGWQKPPFPVLEVRGRKDFIVPFSISFGWSATAPASLQRWATSNGCIGSASVIDICDHPSSGPGCVPGGGTCTTFDQCEGGVAVTQCALNDGHYVYGNPHQFDMCDAAWDKFRQYPGLR